MSQPSFNVLHEPWIPVIRRDGSFDEVGILAGLLQAHNLREIRDPSPIVEFGLYRLLIALVLDALISAEQRPLDTLDLKRLLKANQFDANLLDRYVGACGNVFDLFDEERPFLQTISAKGGEPKPLSGLYPVVPSGTNASMWHHFHEKEMAATAAEAVRLLCTISPFMTAGGAGLSPSINGAPGIYCLPLGETLFETIVLNLPTDLANESGSGKVAWLEDRWPGSERTKATMVEALTWRPRAVSLVASPSTKSEPVVAQIRFEKGDSTRLEWRDPNLAYRFDKEKATPIRMRAGRPLWRDSGPLALLHRGSHGQGKDKVFFVRPSAVENAFGAYDAKRDVRIKSYGMRTDMKMKVFEWIATELAVPSNLGRSTSLGRLVQDELDRADKAAYGLRIALKSLYPREGAGNKAAMGTMCDRAERAYWQGLEPQFHPLMARFADLEGAAASDSGRIVGSALPWWEKIWTLAVDQFDLAAHDMDSDGDAMERAVRARARLTNMLRRMVE